MFSLNGGAVIYIAAQGGYAALRHIDDDGLELVQYFLYPVDVGRSRYDVQFQFVHRFQRIFYFSQGRFVSSLGKFVAQDTYFLVILNACDQSLETTG